MAKQLAIDWDSRHLRLVVANQQPNRIKIEFAKSYPLNTAEDAPLVGEQISELLRNSRFKGLEAVATVRRSDVELRTFNLPPIPPEEIPETVRFQALREFSEVGEDWPIDYLPLKCGENTVLAAAISPQRLKTYTAALTKADLKPSSFVLRPTATASLVKELEVEDHARVELCLEDLDGQFEITVVRDDCPVLIRTVQGPKSGYYDPTKILSQEIRRTALASRDRLQGDSIQQIVLFGQSDDEQVKTLADGLARELNLPVNVLDPFQHVLVSDQIDEATLKQRGQFAAAIGLLKPENAEPSHLIDFLNPRKAPPPKSSRDSIVAGMFAALLLALLCGGGYYYYLQQLDAKKLELQRTIQSQKDSVAAAEGRLADYQTVEQWLLGRVDWMQQLKQISEKVPDADKARFDRMIASLSSSSGNGQIIFEGIANEQTTIAEIDDALRTDGRRVNNAGGEFENRDEELPWRFKHTVVIETEAAKRIAAARAARGNRRLGR